MAFSIVGLSDTAISIAKLSAIGFPYLSVKVFSMIILGNFGMVFSIDRGAFDVDSQ